MSDRSVQDIIAFNQELTALAAAGLPLDFSDDQGPSGTRFQDDSLSSINAILDQVGTALSIRVGRGQSVEQAVMEVPQLPPNYRKALLTFLRCDDPRLALDSISNPATTKRRFAEGIGGALVYPLIVLTIAYFGFLYLCEVTGPKIEALHRQLGQTLPPAVQLLADARNWIPVWGPLVPLMIIAALVWWHLRGSKKSWSWLPGSKRYYRSINNAHLASQLAGMLESGCSLDESLQILLPDANRHDGLPPLLRWAIQGDTGDEPRTKILRFVAETYRRTAEREAKVWRVMTPMLCGLAIAGVLVLCYGLCLFLPVVQLLKDVALPESGLGGV